MSLREKYLQAVANSQLSTRGKQLVSKSALGPDIYAVRDDTGRVVGFAPGEQLSPEEIAKLKQPVSKSAESDLNAVFDSLFDFGEPLTATIGGQPVNATIADVQKSADVDDPLAGIFPLWLQP